MKKQKILFSLVAAIFTFTTSYAITEYVESEIKEKEEKSKLWFQKYDKKESLKKSQEMVKSGEWLDDFEKAIKKSKKENKPLYIEFIGSDWCPGCMVLVNDIFPKKEFKEFAKKNMVLLLIDMPRSIKMPEKQEEQAFALTEIFRVNGFPTGILLSPDLKTMIYRYTGGAENVNIYVKRIQDALDVYNSKAEQKSESK